MIKKIKRFFVDLWEKIFKRMELHNIKLEASFLKDRLDEATDQIEKGEDILKMLYSGDAVRLTHREKMMIQWALGTKSFREKIELPQTKAHIRITYRELREKIKLHLKEDPEVKEDDETKAGDNG